MSKVLFIANSDRHIKLCHLPYMKKFKENGYFVHVATNSPQELPYCDKKINLHLKRNPYSVLNIFALYRVRKLVKREKYDVISCHTPIGGFLGRCSTIGLKKKPKVFYTAHGFHFFKGAKIRNWLIYYPIEKFLSRYTDAVITMNQEDYILAKEKFYCDVYKVHGIGMCEDKLKVTKKNLRKDLSLQNKYIITYIAEVSKRKNQFAFLDTVKKYSLDQRIVFLFIGDSNIKNVSEKFQKYDNVIYLDFKENVGDYISISDLIISPSKQEGLPQNILEAMYFNKMIVANNIRGINDLITSDNGILVNSLEELVEEIQKCQTNEYSKTIKNDIRLYKLSNVMKEHLDIYNQYLLDTME